MRVKHKVRSLPARCISDTSICPVCLTDFHSRVLLRFAQPVAPFPSGFYWLNHSDSFGIQILEDN